MLLVLFFGIIIAMYFFSGGRDKAPATAAAEETVYEEAAAYQSDFFSDFRQKRSAWRDQEQEMLTEMMKNGSTEEAKSAAGEDLKALMQKIKIEDTVEEVLKGRNYQDVIFVLDENLSLLMIKKKDFGKGEQEALLQFAAAAGGTTVDKISFFTIE